MTIGAPTTGSLPAGLAALLRGSRERATRWLLDHVDDDGAPVGAGERQGWGRVPWALAVVGEREAGAAVLSWAERNALTPEYDLPAGPLRLPMAPMYPLAHLGHGAWLLERYDTALGILRRLRDAYQDADGGVTTGDPGHPQTDLICTAQLGLLALVTGERDVADAVNAWIVRLWDAQPELPHRLYVAWEDGLVLDGGHPFTRVVDFTQDRQAWFYPGIAAVFLAGYAQQTGDSESLELGRRFLRLNIEGTPRQFEDTESVQICKFGWGAAAVLEADRTPEFLPHVVRMGEWFVERQAADGSWAPSSFMTPEPDEVDKLVKTAEHLMEMTVISTALGSWNTEH